MKKVVVRLNLKDEKDKKKAMKAVSSLSGVDSISVEMKDKKLTVIGDVDAVEVVEKLRKTWQVDLVAVGPAKEPEKKEDQGKKQQDDKKKNNPSESEQVAELVKFYRNHYPYVTHPYAYTSEEDPNSCVIS